MHMRLVIGTLLLALLPMALEVGKGWWAARRGA